jgi:DNA-directed RNA polymerase subunit beta
MTPRGTFVINGAERVVVSQLHRSPGVFFGQSLHANGTKLYSARIIPFKGSWIEFATDINNVMYAYIDRKKKLPVTTLLSEQLVMKGIKIYWRSLILQMKLKCQNQR